MRSNKLGVKKASKGKLIDQRSALSFKIVNFAIQFLDSCYVK